MYLQCKERKTSVLAFHSFSSILSYITKSETLSGFLCAPTENTELLEGNLIFCRTAKGKKKYSEQEISSEILWISLP